MRIDVSVTHELFWTRLGDPDHSCQQSFNDYILYPAVVWDAVSLMSTADVINIMPFRTGPAAEQMPPHVISEKQSCEREMLPSRGGEKEKAQRGASEPSKLLLSVTTKQMGVGVMPSRTSILKNQCLLCARLSSDPTSSLQ